MKSPGTGPTPLAHPASLFLKLGTLAFGGPAAHIAMMEEEVVRRRQWLTRDRFVDFLGATNLIPGPNSTEMAIHIGFPQAGWRGLFVPGIVPSQPRDSRCNAPRFCHSIVIPLCLTFC